MSTVTTNKGYVIPGNGENVNTWDSPVRDTINAIDTGLGSTYSISLSSSNVTLTLAQCQNLFFALSGTLTANVIVYVQAVGGIWSVDNQTTGAFTVTFKTLAGGSTGVSVVQGVRSLIKSNGTNVYFADDRVVGTVTSVATGTGLTGGPVTTSGTLSLANTAVTPSTYGSATQSPVIIVDAQGRITGASNTTINALPTQTGNSGKFLTTDGTTASWGSATPKIIADAFVKGNVAGVAQIQTGAINIASVTRTGTGVYAVVFTANAPDVNYRIYLTSSATFALNSIAYTSKVISGFTINFAGYNGGTFVNGDCDFNLLCTSTT